VRVTVGNQNSVSPVSGLHLLPPVVSSITPSTGPALGGSSVTLTVTNLYDFVAVNFNYTLGSPPMVRQATQCVVTMPSTINCKSPSVPFSSLYNISVTVGNLTGPQTIGYRYDNPSVSSISPESGATTGGYQISIIGVNFGTGPGQLAPPQVNFGPNSCGSPVRVNDSLITCIAPAVH
jgi:IPT/TIG domain